LEVSAFQLVCLDDSITIKNGEYSYCYKKEVYWNTLYLGLNVSKDGKERFWYLLYNSKKSNAQTTVGSTRANIIPYRKA
jgi:hypothetical protein